MKKNHLYTDSIFRIYVLWSLILMLHGTWVVFTSKFSELVGAEAFLNFIIMFYVALMVVFVIGAFLAWYTEQGKFWALWLFTVYCLYRSIDGLYSITVRESMEGVSVNITDWVKGLFIAFVWLTLVGFAWYLRYTKSPKSTTEAT